MASGSVSARTAWFDGYMLSVDNGASVTLPYSSYGTQTISATDSIGWENVYANRAPIDEPANPSCNTYPITNEINWPTGTTSTYAGQDAYDYRSGSVKGDKTTFSIRSNHVYYGGGTRASPNDLQMSFTIS
jgi:hypothetical protein